MLFTRHRELTRDTAETIRGRLATSLRGTDLGLSERCDPLLILASTTTISKVALDIVASQITKHVVVENERAQINGSLGETPANIASPHRPHQKTSWCLLKPHFRGAVLSCDTISRLNYSAADWLSFSLLNPQLQRTVTMVNMRAVGTSSPCKLQLSYHD